MSFSIFCLCKDGSLSEQAKVVESNDSFEINLNPLPLIIHHMDSYLTELFELMMKYEKEYPYCDHKIYQTKLYKYANDEFVQATIFHRVLMRKGSYFYIYQKSDRGSRFLLYAVDRVHHSSIAFGNSMRVPDVVEQRNEMKEILAKQSFNLHPSLIENSSLYFL